MKIGVLNPRHCSHSWVLRDPQRGCVKSMPLLTFLSLERSSKGMCTVLCFTGQAPLVQFVARVMKEFCFSSHLTMVTPVCRQHSVLQQGAGIAQWSECQIHDWKVAGSNPCRSSGRISFSRVDFLCWLLFRYPFTHITAIARKTSRSFCQKCRWQVTAKHAYTLRMWLYIVTWCMVIWCTLNMRWDGSCLMCHQPCERCKYTTSVDIKKKMRYKKPVTHVEPHASAASLLKKAENSAI